ncbi:MAG: hypothetical protein LBK70_01455, partial [Clostridiales bacterium]|nr:hypothetical protein [Clostridiales bacterium]
TYTVQSTLVVVGLPIDLDNSDNNENGGNELRENTNLILDKVVVGYKYDSVVTISINATLDLHDRYNALDISQITYQVFDSSNEPLFVFEVNKDDVYKDKDVNEAGKSGVTITQDNINAEIDIFDKEFPQYTCNIMIDAIDYSTLKTLATDTSHSHNISIISTISFKDGYTHTQTSSTNFSRP